MFAPRNAKPLRQSHDAPGSTSRGPWAKYEGLLRRVVDKFTAAKRPLLHRHAS